MHPEKKDKCCNQFKTKNISLLDLSNEMTQCIITGQAIKLSTQLFFFFFWNN